jgi:hypothetical protein
MFADIDGTDEEENEYDCIASVTVITHAEHDRPSNANFSLFFLHCWYEEIPVLDSSIVADN